MSRMIILFIVFGSISRIIWGLNPGSSSGSGDKSQENGDEDLSDTRVDIPRVYLLIILWLLVGLFVWVSGIIEY